jgi:hypothetical protein
MSTVIFTDGTHELTMRRVQYSVSDSFSIDSDSSILTKGVKVEIKAKAKRTEIQNYKMWSWDGTSLNRNIIGNLSFQDNGVEYLKIENIFINNLSEDSETWMDWGDLSATFSNESANSDRLGVISFKGKFDIYNAQISVIPSFVKKSFKAVQGYNGSFYQETGYDLVRVNLSGTVPWTSSEFPSDIIDSLESIVEKDGGVIPEEKSMTEFLPDIVGIPYSKMIVENATVTWDIERKTLSVGIGFVGPNQSMVN